MAAFITFPEATIISELRSTIMDRIHMGGTFLQQAPKVTINGLPVAIKQGGIGSLGSSLTGSLGALGGLSGLAGLANQIAGLQELSNLSQLADIKSLAGNLSGLGDSLGGLGDLTKNLGDITSLSSMLSDVVSNVGDISSLGSFSSIVENLGGIDGLKDQLSQVSGLSKNLGSLNDLTSSITTQGTSALLQNPLSGNITDSLSKVNQIGSVGGSGLLNQVSSKMEAVSPGLSYSIDSSMSSLTTSLSKFESHTNILSGITEKRFYEYAPTGVDQYYYDTNDLVRIGTQLNNNLGMNSEVFLQNAASALYSTDTLNSINENITVDIIDGFNIINSLTPDGGANDAIILQVSERISSSINNHTSTIGNIVENDLTAANYYDEKIKSTSTVETVSNTINADGFSSLKNLLVKPEYMDLMSYK
jgi:hypothetical protein